MRVYVNEECIRNGRYIVISTDVDNYASSGLNGSVMILTDTVLLAGYRRIITVGPYRLTWLSGENVLSDNVSPTAILCRQISFSWMRLQEGSRRPLYPLICQNSMPLNSIYTKEFVTGDAVLITGGFVHCAGNFVGFQTDAARTRS